MYAKTLSYFLKYPLIPLLLSILLLAGSLSVSPFPWASSILPRSPIPVDAIPDLGENQQIVFTQWPGNSPQDVEDQVSYPLSTALLGIPGVETIRCSSAFGFSSIYLIFEEGMDFYWCRSRILEKLASLPPSYLPQGASPSLGPDATALGQVFWYTLEGRDSTGMPTGGWSLQELREIQDFYLAQALQGPGISEVASIGGYVQEYQVDVDPQALQAYGISMMQVAEALKESNRDAGAKTVEINRAEYLVRGLGKAASIQDFEEILVGRHNQAPILLKDIARVYLGPGERRGALDKGGVPAVGGVAVARYGVNPMEAIRGLKDRIADIEGSLPSKTLSDGSISQLKVVPFYDRGLLIRETLATLEDALLLEVLITIAVVLLMIRNFSASLLVSSMMPLSILMVFLFMKLGGVEANIVALSGIAIAIGTMVDLGIVLTENIFKRLRGKYTGGKSPTYAQACEEVLEASREVGSAIATAVGTTIISFLPVFALEAAEGRLFRPLAFTKTFALLSALITALFLLPPLAAFIVSLKPPSRAWGRVFPLSFGKKHGKKVLKDSKYHRLVNAFKGMASLLSHPVSRLSLPLLWVVYLLGKYWMPLGAGTPLLGNVVFAGSCLGAIVGLGLLLENKYETLLRKCLRRPWQFLLLPSASIGFGLLAWLGYPAVFSWIPATWELVNGGKGLVEETRAWQSLAKTFPGIGEEFMPSLDEGDFLLMPTSMPHAGMDQNLDVMQALDILVEGIPEVSEAVGKMGRVTSALDPAPLSMYENLIHYFPEYASDASGRALSFRVDGNGDFLLSGLPYGKGRKHESTLSSEKDWIAFDGDTLLLNGRGQPKDPALPPLPKDFSPYLIPEEGGMPYRHWRRHIKSRDDIWEEIANAAQIPGVTSAPPPPTHRNEIGNASDGNEGAHGHKGFWPQPRGHRRVQRAIGSFAKGSTLTSGRCRICRQNCGKTLPASRG